MHLDLGFILWVERSRKMFLSFQQSISLSIQNNVFEVDMNQVS
jgi:hypothetical protein